MKTLNLKTYSKTKRQANQGLQATEVPSVNKDVYTYDKFYKANSLKNKDPKSITLEE